MAWLRHAAAVEYATDQNSCSVEDLHKRLVFSVASVHTLRSWAQEDKWTERRSLYQRDLQEKLQRAIGDKLVQRRIRTMERLDAIQEKVLTKLETDAVTMNSWEGVAARQGGYIARSAPPPHG